MPPESHSEADFRILGLDPGSEQSEVKRAYRALAKKWHPDRHHSKPFEVRALAEERFKQINDAYGRITSDQKMRIFYPEKFQTGATTKANTAEPAEQKSSADHLQKRRFAGIRSGRVAPVLVLVILLLALGYQLSSFFFDNSSEIETPPPRITLENSANPDAEPRDSADSKTSLEALSELLTQVPAPSAPLLQPGESAKSYFTIGSTSQDVLLVQGAPSRIIGQTWTYGLSEIQFKNGQVWRYNNFDGSLKVLMEPRANKVEQAPPSYITLGSTEDEVLLVQGTPSRVEQEKWFYGFAEVRFKDGRLREYDNYFGTLRVRLVPSSAVGPDRKRTFFTIGSTPDEVLALQGTPTSVHGNLWSFDFASVFFRNGKVHYVTNTDGTLRFLPREDIGNSSGS
jgi:hypothetical protein